MTDINEQEADKLVSLSATVRALSRIMQYAEIQESCRRGFVAYMKLAIGHGPPYKAVAIGQSFDYLFRADAMLFILDHCTPNFALLAIKKKMIKLPDAFGDVELADSDIAETTRHIVHGTRYDESAEIDIAAATATVLNMTSSLIPNRFREMTRCATVAAIAHLTGANVS